MEAEVRSSTRAVGRMVSEARETQLSVAEGGGGEGGMAERDGGKGQGEGETSRGGRGTVIV